MRPHESGPDPLTEELNALAAATEALRNKDFELAASTAHRARSALNAGVLGGELALVEVEALCALGRANEAAVVARDVPIRLRTRFVDERLRQSCAERP